MEHSVVSPDGRVFCVRTRRKLVTKAGLNQCTGCFDNIEIPSKIFRLYEKHQIFGRKGLILMY